MKRFYKTVACEQMDDGWAVTLDGRAIKTPGKATLLMPTLKVAELAALEWDEQGDEVKPLEMPVTCLVNTAIDRVKDRMDEIADEVVAYGGNDLICYRADDPDDLVQRQCQLWDPYVAWAGQTLNAPLKVTSGITHVSQEKSAMSALLVAVKAYDAHALTGLHALTTGLGSLVLALASQQRDQPFEDIWQAALLEELYQVEHWGEDYEASDMRGNLRRDMAQTIAYMQALKA